MLSNQTQTQTKMITEDSKSFISFSELLLHLEKVESVTEWKSVNSDLTEFTPSDDNNPFPTLGGNEFGFDVSFNSGYTKLPLRFTALSSILSRADITGRGILRLLEAYPHKFCEHLNDYFEVKPDNRKEMLALIQDGKLSALHSANYAKIPMEEIFESINNYLEDNFGTVEFIAGNWSWELTIVTFKITDSSFNKVYTDLLSKYLSNAALSSSVELKVISSDVSESAVRVYPYISLNGGRNIPLAGSTATRHYGNASIEKVKDGFDDCFKKFEASVRSLSQLSDVKINNLKNTMIKAFTFLRIPQKYAANLCENYSNIGSNAMLVYTYITDALEIMKKSGMGANELIRYEETISKLLTISERTWKTFDVPGTVAWSAKEK